MYKYGKTDSLLPKEPNIKELKIPINRSCWFSESGKNSFFLTIKKLDFAMFQLKAHSTTWGLLSFLYACGEISGS